jgi:predicted DNA-binding transcriptional regulator AlpA
MLSDIVTPRNKYFFRRRCPAYIIYAPLWNVKANGLRDEPLDRLLYKPEVLRIVGCSYPTLWHMMRRDQFPRSIVVGTGVAARVAWLESEIREWIETRPRSRLLGDPAPLPPTEPEPRKRRRLPRKEQGNEEEGLEDQGEEEHRSGVVGGE